MPLIVEDGTGVPNADSYADLVTIAGYAAAYGGEFDITAGAEQIASEQAARRATRVLDRMFRSLYPGYRLNGREQKLEWPRGEALDADEKEIPDDVVPDEIIEAMCRLAIIERADPGTLDETLARGIESVKAGSVEVKFSGDAGGPLAADMPDIAGILAPILIDPDKVAAANNSAMVHLLRY